MKVGFWKRLRIRLTPHHLLPRVSKIVPMHGRIVLWKTIHPRARLLSVLRHGKPFIETFHEKKIGKKKECRLVINPSYHESLVCVQIEGKYDLLATARLGFQRRTIVIESLQGGGNAQQMNQLRRTLGTPWPNYLLHQIETHARNVGMKWIKIPDPRDQDYYKNPHINGKSGGKNPDKDFLKMAAELRQRLEAFYAMIAEKNGYTKQGRFYIKRLG